MSPQNFNERKTRKRCLRPRDRFIMDASNHLKIPKSSKMKIERLKNTHFFFNDCRDPRKRWTLLARQYILTFFAGGGCIDADSSDRRLICERIPRSQDRICHCRYLIFRIPYVDFKLKQTHLSLAVNQHLRLSFVFTTPCSYSKSIFTIFSFCVSAHSEAVSCNIYRAVLLGKIDRNGKRFRDFDKESNS